MGLFRKNRAARGRAKAQEERFDSENPRPRTLSKKQKRKKLVAALARVLACVAVLASTFLLALLVGDADYKATAIGWAPHVACAAAIVGAFIYILILRWGLQLEEYTTAASCPRNTSVGFKTHVNNRTPLFFFRVEVYFYIADLYGNIVSSAMTTLSLSPFEKYELEINTTFEHIGTYSAGLDRVVIYDYLRLFSRTLPGPKRTKVQVTPQITGIERIEFSNDADLETTKALRSSNADSMDYAGVRDYAYGDSLRAIHWKLSARGDNYLTRIYEVYNNPGVCVIMDFYGPGNNPHELMTMFDAVVESALSMAVYAQRQGLETEMHFTNVHGEKVRRLTWGERDMEEMVAEMPRFSNDEKKAVAALELVQLQTASVTGQNNIIICTANITAPMINAVVDCKMSGRNPIVVAVAPATIEGRERDRWRSPLVRLDESGIGYVVLSHASELAEVGR